MKEHPQPLSDVTGDGIPPVPLALWNWGIKERSGNLRQMDSKDIEIALMLKEQALVTKEGITFKRSHYTCETAQNNDWFSIARTKSSWNVDVAYNPSNMDEIYLLRGKAITNYV